LNKKQTSRKVASTASKILRDKRTSKASKSVAGSALSQTPSTKKINSALPDELGATRLFLFCAVNKTKPCDFSRFLLGKLPILVSVVLFPHDDTRS